MDKTITGRRDFRWDVDWSDSQGTIKAPVPYNIPLSAFTIEGTMMDVDGTSAPGIATTDNVPAIVWADDETSAIEYTFRIPPGMEGSRLKFRGFASTDVATTPPTIDWDLFVNFDGTAFDAAAYGADPVTLTNISTTANETFILEPDATAQAGLLEGGWVTIRLWNTTTGSGTLELKGLEYYFDKD
jgi:hypothetical protein